MSLRLVHSAPPRRAQDDLGAFQGFLLGIVFAIPIWTLIWLGVATLFSLEPRK